MDIKYVKQELAKHPKATFLDLAAFNQSSIGACDIQGESPVWEMHPDTDEFFYILEGEVSFLLLEPQENSSQENNAHESTYQETNYTAEAGAVFVIPKGIWHKPSSAAGVTFLYMTPGTTLHSENPMTED